MNSWVRGRTVFQLVALALLALSVIASLILRLSAGISTYWFVVLALIVCFFAFRNELLWRVRNRLLVTYFMVGIVPIFLIAWILTLSCQLLLGQFATQLVRQGLEAKIESIRSAAHSLTVAASTAEEAEILSEVRKQTPEVQAVVLPGDTFNRLAANGAFQTAPAWIPNGFAGLFELTGRYYMGANARSERTTAFVYLPLNKLALASLAPGLVSVPIVVSAEDRTNVDFSGSGSRITVFEKGSPQEIASNQLRTPRGWWDVPVAGMLSWTALSPSGKSDVLLPLVSRPSLLVASVAGDRMTSIVLSMLVAIAGFFLVVELASLFSSLGLTRAITRSTGDLYKGTQRVAEGDFSNQIPVRGKHQLSELANSFNNMTAKIQHLIGEVKKKEKLDAELEIAREVQFRLYPKSPPKLKSLEIAAVCIPGRVVSGDYYDFVPLDDRSTAIALGDVSGKGVSAALLMASIQSALRAQLKFSTNSSSSWSTAKLTEFISQQLYENTPPEKYATLFCSIYDDEAAQLIYTNAGHPKPILVRNGLATTLDGGGLAAGLLPNVKYDQQHILLKTGDLLAVFSDGIPEAQDATEEEFGEARLAELLASQTNQSLDGILQAVIAAAKKWTYDPEGRDDLTLLLLRKL